MSGLCDSPHNDSSAQPPVWRTHAQPTASHLSLCNTVPRQLDDGEIAPAYRLLYVVEADPHRLRTLHTHDHCPRAAPAASQAHTDSTSGSAAVLTPAAAPTAALAAAVTSH